MNHFSLRLFIPTVSLALFLGLYSTAWSMAEKPQKPQVTLHEGLLSAVQIKQLFSGKTVTAEIEGKNRTQLFYFASNGKVQRIRKGWQKNGTWKVRKDGRLCITYKGSRRDCRIIVKQGDRYQQYAVKKDGNNRYEITYTEFFDGRQLARRSKEPILPKGTLKSKEIVKLFSGQTVESVTARKGRVSLSYYSPNGALEQLREGMKRSGKWRVKKNGRICLQFENLKEKCRIIVRQKGKIKKYIVRKNGRHQHSVSYRNFIPGRQL